MKSIISLYKDSFANLQRNVWILSITMFINRSGSMVLLFTSLYLTKNLHFTISDAGMILSFYGIGSVLGSYFGGWLTDRRHYYSIMINSLLISGTILFLLLFVKSQVLISLVIFLYAFTADVFRPANSKAITLYSTPENRTRSLSLVRLAVNLGFSVGPAVGGFVAFYLGYKWLFIIDALTSYAAAFMLYKYLPNKPSEVVDKKSNIETIKSPSAYKDYAYLLFILLVAIYGLCFFQLFASVPQYFSHVCNYSEDTIGLLLALNGLLVVLFELPFVSKFGSNAKAFMFIIIGVLCLPLSFMMLNFGGGLILWSILYTIVITFSEIFAMPFMMNFALSRPQPDRQGQYSALYSISYGLANIGAPIIGLAIANHYGFNMMFYVFSVLAMLTAILFYIFKVR